MDRRPLLLFDGQCGSCRAWAERLARWDRRGAIRRLPYQARAEVAGLPPLDAADLDRALHVVLPDGRVAVGARGIIALLPWLPGGRLLGAAARLPGAGAAADAGYRWMARRRRRDGGAECEVR